MSLFGNLGRKQEKNPANSGTGVERRFGELSPRKVLLIAGSIVLWAVALLMLLVFLGVGEEFEPAAPVFGSREGRFVSDNTMTQDSVAELLTTEECLAEALQPDERSIALLKSVYQLSGWIRIALPAIMMR